MKLLISLFVAVWLPRISKTETFCGPPPPVNFASVANEKEKYSIGETVTYSCHFGYVTAGYNRPIICEIYSIREAKWTETEVVCVPRSCGDPGLVEHGHRTGSLFTFPNYVTYECNEGYKLHGNDKRYCQTNGIWSGRLPTCQKRSCNPPSDPENGRVEYTSLEYLSELHYECDKGYQLNTEDVVYCTEDGEWSKTDVLCEEASCPFPEEPQNGHVKLSSPDGVPRSGSFAIFSCDDGMEMEGPSTSKCLENGEWIFPAPNCLEPCSIPFVENGKIGHYPKGSRYWTEITVGTPVESGQKLFLTCSPGYEPLGSSDYQAKVICSEGRWSDKPDCIPASCRLDPPSTENARIQSANSENGGTVVYHCLNNFRKVRTGNVTCDHGVWKGRTPACKDTRCYIEDLQVQGLQIPNGKTVYSSGESFTVKCNSRYQITVDGRERFKCEDGDWQGPTNPCYAASCSKSPPTITNGRIESWSEVHGSTVTFTCDRPFTMKGTSTVRCEFGEWIGNLPQCINDMCKLSDLKNSEGVSSETPTFTASGYILNVRCIDGYSVSAQVPLCENGRWSLNYASPCKEGDCLVRRIPNGYLEERHLGPDKWSWTQFKFVRKEYYTEIPVNTVLPNGFNNIVLRCANGYSVQGLGHQRALLVCSRGYFHPDPVCLLRGQRYIPTVRTTTTKQTTTQVNINSRTTPMTQTSTARASQTTSLPRAKSSTTPVSKTVDETTEITTTEIANDCFCDYTSTNDKLLAFVDGHQLSYGSIVKHDSYVKFRCKIIGYHRFSGPHEILCKDCRAWSPSELPNCTDPMKHEPVVFFNESIPVSEDGVLQIKEGNLVRINCVTSTDEYPTWNVTDGDRIFTRSGNINTENGVFHTTHLFMKGVTIEDEGYYACAVEDASPVIIRIRVEIPDASCPLFLDEENFIIEYSDEQYPASIVSFTCRNDQKKIVGKARLNCLSNGQWSDSPPVCEDITCPVLQETDLLSVSYSDGQNIGSVANFHCFSPGIASGEPRTTCLENGQWGHISVTCRAPPCPLQELFEVLPNGVRPNMEDINNDTVPYGTVLELECEPGKHLVGDIEAKCVESSQWSIGNMQCESGCRRIEKFPESELIIYPTKEKYVLGESISFFCPPGKRLDLDVQRIMCLRSGWSESVLPDCEDIPEDKET